MSERTMAGIGERIRSLRLRMDRSEQSFAALIGVEPEVVRAWEQGRAIDRDALLLIAAATDAQMEWLIAGLTPTEVEAVRAAARLRSGPTAGDDRIARGAARVTPSASGWIVLPEGEAARARKRSPARGPEKRRP